MSKIKMEYLHHAFIFLTCVSPVLGTAVAALIIHVARKDTRVLQSLRQCNVCHHRFLFRELIPLFGYILMRGKCKSCHNSKTPIYCFSESASLLACISMFCLLQNPSLLQVISLFLIALFLIGLSIFDITLKRLPDIATIPFLLLGFSQSYLLNYIDFFDSVLGVIAGGAVSSIVSVAYTSLRGRVGLGWGDVKLIAAFGAWVGWQALPLFVLWASVFGILVIFFRSITIGQFNVNEQIPFGPFLCASGWLIWLRTIN